MTDWHSIKAADFAFPDGASLEDLLDELVAMLSSPDPVARDEIAFSALATWISGGVVPDDRLHPLGDTAAALLRADAVQARSFAALVLDVLVSSRGVCDPAWVDEFERWYADEQDLRGHDPELGWLHAVAHGADLLGDLGLHPDVDPSRMLDLAATRMLAPTELVWRDQEDDRLGYAIAKVLTRDGLTEDTSTGWLARVEKTLAEGEPGPVPPFATNTFHTLRSTYVVLRHGVRLGDRVVPAPWRDSVTDRIAAVLHLATPWMW